MRLRELATCTVLLVGCSDDKLPAPTIVEPAADVILDRCRVRVRVEDPNPELMGAGYGNNMLHVPNHENWRVDGGEITEIVTPTLDRDPATPYMFGATLRSGTSLLEVGACDGFDTCTWSSREITVALHAGSPDAAYAGSGQLVLSGLDPYWQPVLLADGRVLMGRDDAMRGYVMEAIGENGRPDEAFGDHGIVLVPTMNKKLVPLASGFLFVFASAVTWYGNDGLPIGTFGVAGTAQLDPTKDLTVTVARVTGTDLTLAGFTRPSPTDPNVIEGFITTLSATGTQLAYHALDTSIPADIDATGTVVSLGGTTIRLDTTSGPITTFGVGGVLAIADPSGGTTAVFAGGGLALGQITTSDPQKVFVTELTMTGATVGHVDIPFPSPSRPPLMASASDGSLYLTNTNAHPMEDASLVRDNIDGSDIAIARIRDHAVDTTFGDHGIGHASFMVVRDPIVLETILDTPTQLAITAAGAPLVMGMSRGIVTDERMYLRRVDPAVAVVRFLP